MDVGRPMAQGGIKKALLYIISSTHRSPYVSISLPLHLSISSGTWVDGEVDRWVDERRGGGWMLRLVHVWMHGWVGVWLDGWVDGSADGWVCGWVNGWADGWMDGWLGGSVDEWIGG